MTVQPYIVLQQVDPPGPAITFLLGDGYTLPQAEGGWETIARPKDVAFVNWNGYEPVRQDVPVVLDGYATDTSVEPQLSNLFSMERVPQGPRNEPPVVTISGPVAHANLRWVLSNVAFVDEIRRESDGQRVRATLTLSLLEYIVPDVLTRKSPAKDSQRRNGKTTTRRYTVKHGDTLPKIAVRIYHKASRWHDIAKLNHLRDPKKIKVGQVLRLP